MADLPFKNLQILFQEKGTELAFPNHYRMLLEDEDYLFFLASGNMDLVILDIEKAPETQSLLSEPNVNSTPMLAEILVGAKTFIQNLEKGALIFPFPFDEKRYHHLLLRSNRRCTLYKMLKKEVQKALDRSPELKKEFQSQVHDWISFFSFLFIHYRFEKMNNEFNKDSKELLLKQNEIIAPVGAIGFLGITPEKGRFLLIGNDSLVIEQDSHLLYPICKEMWLQCASTEGFLKVNNCIDKNIWKGLNLFHEHILKIFVLNTRLNFQKINNFVKHSNELAQRNYESSKKELDLVLQDQEYIFKEATLDPLFKACQIVGNTLGIHFKPVDISNSETVLEHVNKICFVSGIFSRLINLEENWWKQNWGPFVGFYGPELKPVALLPTEDNRYNLIDVEKQQTKIVDEKIDKEIFLSAFVFYRALPDKKRLFGKDIIKFCLQNRGKIIINLVLLSVLGLLYSFFYPFATKILYAYILPISDLLLLIELGVALLVILGISTLFSFARERLFLYFKGIVEHDLQIGVWQRMFQLPVQFFRRYEVGDLIMRAFAVERIRDMIGGYNLRIIINSAFSFLFLIPMLYFSPFLTVASLCLIIPVIGFSFYNIFSTYKTNSTIVQDQQEANALIIQYINGISKIRNAGTEKISYVLWEKVFFRIKKNQWLQEKKNNLANVLNFTFEQSSNLLIFAIILFFINNLANDGLNLPNFLAFLAVFTLFRNTVVDLCNTLLYSKSIFPLWKSSQVIFKEPPEIDETRLSPPPLKGEIKIEHVSFRYDPDSPLIVDDVSFQVNPEEFVAIVGGSGSGKSTLVRLLIGFETPESGAIYYDGKDLNSLNLRQLRKQIGTVLQSSNIFDGTLKENVALGEKYTDDEVKHALYLAGFEEDLKRLPMGLHTLLSQSNIFSGGQRQRIIIARTLIARPKILIFDEATAALDNQIQDFVSHNIFQLNVTRLVIAHRLSTIKQADRILVLDKAKIIEMGTFDELLEKKGFFYNMIQKQKFELS